MSGTGKLKGKVKKLCAQVFTVGASRIKLLGDELKIKKLITRKAIRAAKSDGIVIVRQKKKTSRHRAPVVKTDSRKKTIALVRSARRFLKQNQSSITSSAYRAAYTKIKNRQLLTRKKIERYIAQCGKSEKN